MSQKSPIHSSAQNKLDKIKKMQDKLKVLKAEYVTDLYNQYHVNTKSEKFKYSACVEELICTSVDKIDNYELDASVYILTFGHKKNEDVFYVIYVDDSIPIFSSDYDIMYAVRLENITPDDIALMTHIHPMILLLDSESDND